MNNEQKYVKKYGVNLIEYESGWGSRVDDTKLFDTADQAKKFVIEFNSENDAIEVPDWYMIAEYVGEKFVKVEE